MARIRPASEAASERMAFAAALHELISRTRPAKLIETGTFLGTGSTQYIAGALKDAALSLARFFSIEANPQYAQEAAKNLAGRGLGNFVTVLNGLSVPRKLLPDQQQIENRLVRRAPDLIRDRDIFVDHSELDRASSYFNETNHDVPDDLLGSCLAKFDFAPDLVLLDSAGHLGNVEFDYLLSLLRGPCHIVLDDVHHVKHCESLRKIKTDDRFELILESEEQCGFCVAKFVTNPSSGERTSAPTQSASHKRPGRIFYSLPALPRNGGIKVCIQHSHLLNGAGFETYVITPKAQVSPYPAYKEARFMTWQECFDSVRGDDLFVFSWAADVEHFLHLKNTFYFFSQGVINKNDQVLHTAWLNDRFRLITIGKHSRDFYFYGYGQPSKIVNNWINCAIFFPDPEKRVANRVGIIKHREHFDGTMEKDLEALGFSTFYVGGSESEVAEQLRACDYFLGCSKGVFNGHDFAEGFSLPGAEAMASGCLLVTYNNHGCLEYALDQVNSRVAWENTKADLLAKLVETRESEVREQLRQNGVFTIRQRFNPSAILRQIKAVLELRDASVSVSS